MRIISGKWKGLHIVAPSNLPVRPTTDMAKEGLFNWLSNSIDFEGLRAMDLCSGTGNITFELLSRGAEHVTVVDKNIRCTAFIEQKSKELNVSNQISIFKTDALVALRKITTPVQFIFADPPYDYPDYERLALQIVNCEMWQKQTYAVIEHPKHVNFGQVKPSETRNYGKVHFSLFQKF
jgi:16S rRNA (guanine(966)-N(2))-methyltransferase RsmD